MGEFAVYIFEVNVTRTVTVANDHDDQMVTAWVTVPMASFPHQKSVAGNLLPLQQGPLDI